MFKRLINTLRIRLYGPQPGTILVDSNSNAWIV